MLISLRGSFTLFSRFFSFSRIAVLSVLSYPIPPQVPSRFRRPIVRNPCRAHATHHPLTPLSSSSPHFLPLAQDPGARELVAARTLNRDSLYKGKEVVVKIREQVADKEREGAS